MKLIVGLGNAGPDYVGTRHNVGFEVVDVLAARWRISLAAEKFHGWFGQGDFGGERVALLKPTTLMNRSGQAVVAAGRFYKLGLADLLVIADDEWCRLRIGIGEAIGDAAGYVLGRFDKTELEVIDRAKPRAADAVECWIEKGPELTMTRFNSDPPA